jgi:hypothetical protein
MMDSCGRYGAPSHPSSFESPVGRLRAGSTPFWPAGRPVLVRPGRAQSPVRPPWPGKNREGRYRRSRVRVGGGARARVRADGAARHGIGPREAGLQGRDRDATAARHGGRGARAQAPGSARSHGSKRHHGGPPPGTRTPAASPATHPGQPPAATTPPGFPPSQRVLTGDCARPGRTRTGRPAGQNRALPLYIALLAIRHLREPRPSPARETAACRSCPARRRSETTRPIP